MEMKKNQIRKAARNSRGKTFLKQRGIVLLVTLLVLVAMMLVSVGIMRSVDTSTMAVSNMAFRQAAEASANQAIETAVKDLFNGALAGETAYNNAAPDYFAWYSPSDDNAQGIPDFRLNAIRGETDENSKNTTRTLIERMCSAQGQPNPPTVVCLAETLADRPGVDNSINKAGEDQDDLNASGSSGGGGGAVSANLYRISVRVDGPNGSVAYAQAVISRP
ncbi:MAG: hypothetical protein LBB65_06285 [Burkholderiales bacterium]|jgi:Tfp pilus assembly protein PilX|nr:hypothetical protein [Burkholderiales bacterium]